MSLLGDFIDSVLPSRKRQRSDSDNDEQDVGNPRVDPKDRSDVATQRNPVGGYTTAQSDTPYRPQQLVVVSSAQRQNFSTDDPGNCRVVLPVPSVSFTSVELLSWSVPNSVYNISAALSNNGLSATYTAGGAKSFAVAIPDGQYSASSLVIVLQALINSVIGGGATCTVYYNPTPGTVSGVDGNADNKLVFYWAGGASAIHMRFDYNPQLSDYTGTFYQQAGFASGSVAVTAGTYFKGTRAVDLSYPQGLSLTIPELLVGGDQLFNATGTQSASYISGRPQFYLPLTAGNNTLVYNSNDTLDSKRNLTWRCGQAQTIQQFSLVFRDYLGNVVNFNGANWTVTLRLVFD